MKSLKTSLVFLVLLLSARSNASHIYGGELYYTHLSGLNYRVTLTLFGDCSPASQQSFSALFSAAPIINVFQSTALVASINLVLDTNSIVEVTPVCPAEAPNTACRSATATLPGIKKFSYSNDISLPAPSQYSFVFAGNLGPNGGSAGRTASITNLASPSQLIYLVAELNNFLAPNSSSLFTTVPTPFYCVNLLQQYNQGAIDPDHDSLAFSLIPALDQGSPALYAPGFSGVYPISTVNGLFDMNAINGQISFTPDIVQKGLVVNRVTEYRNGVVVGSATREMTFVVLNNCQNTPPLGQIDSTAIVGGQILPGNVIDVCEGTQLVSFTYPITDAEGDSVGITYTTLPSGSTLNIINNNTPTPSLNFNWNTSSLPAGVYNFFVTLRDSHCPLNSQETRGFTIHIVSPPALLTSVISPTACAHKAVIRYDITGANKPYVVTIKQGSNTIKTYTDTSGSFSDSLAVGNYTVDVTSQKFECISTFPLVVVDSGVYPYDPLFNNPILCTGIAPSPLVAIPTPAATVHWYDIEGNLLPDTPTPNTSIPGTSYWILSQQYLVCESKKDTVKVVVAPKPEVVILNQNKTLCYGDKIPLKASGADSYVWLPADKIFWEPDSSEFVRIYEPSSFTVIASSGVGCKDTAGITFDHIEQCCQFSYPNAFTPNGDNRNDTWKPIMYGNQEYYELSIFNRWGTVLFHSFIPTDTWNGMYEGKPQDVGTYFYYMKAKCLTGYAEEHKGEFILLR